MMAIKNPSKKMEMYLTESRRLYRESATQDRLGIETYSAPQIARANREWEATVDALPQLIFLLDHQKHILRANRTVEHWQLGQISEVIGQDVHSILHRDCKDSPCYLVTLLDQAWQELTQGQPIEYEAKDDTLMRHLQLRVKPISAQSLGRSRTSDSYVVLVLDDITDYKQTEATLRQYALDLTTRNQELDAFAHTVAHNLKGPLAPILGYAELLRTSWHTMPDEMLQNDLERIAQCGRRMKKIIEELLLLASVRKREVEKKPLNMDLIVIEVQMRLAHMIEQYHAKLTLPESWPMAFGYGPWIEEVWVNYISNAIKFGGNPPRVELGATVLDGPDASVRFWVRDNGSGLTQDQQAQLFTPFTRLNREGTGGHGLGLSIVRHIVDKLGGQVDVESDGVPGQGCVFSFMLPSNTV